MLVEQQIAERRERARDAIAKVLERPDGEPYGDYRVKSASGKTYRVAMRGPGLFENYCSCPDFASTPWEPASTSRPFCCGSANGMATSSKARRMRARAPPFLCSTAKPSISACACRPLRRPLCGKLAEQYFDPAGLLRREHFRSFHRVIEAFRKADGEAVIYSDVLEYLDRENELAEGLDLERQLLAKLHRGHDPLHGLLKTKLLPYQERGAIFAACRGRVVLADDMGLGKTVQALAAAEMLRRRRGIQRVLVVAPASVKYQWKTEIEKFTDLPAQVIDGLLPRGGNCMPPPSSSTFPATNWS
jgi:hypothetical protein